MNYPFFILIRSGLVIVAAALLGQCQSPVAEYKLNEQVNSALKNGTKSVPICHLFTGQWDSMLVVNAYTPPSFIRKFNIANYSAISDLVSKQETDEATCTLLFSMKNKYVGYKVIYRMYIDFSELPRHLVKSHFILSKSTCDQVVISQTPQEGEGRFYAHYQ